MISRNKLNSIESKISEALMNNEISHEDLTTIINEERNYRELTESIRVMKGQEDKTIDKKCRKDAESINPRALKTSNGKTMILFDVLYVVVENQNLLKNKKQAAY